MHPAEPRVPGPGGATMPTKCLLRALPGNLTHDTLGTRPSQAGIPRNAFSKKSQEAGVLTTALVCREWGVISREANDISPSPGH